MKFSTTPAKTSLLTAFIALNLTIGGLVSWLKLPIYLDSLGIVLATILLGWRYGALCALLTCGLGFFIVSPYLLAYVGTSLAITCTVESLRRRNMYRSFGRTIICGLIVALVAAVVSAPVTAFLFGGVTASGADFLTAILLKTGQNIMQAVLLSGISSESVDKTVVAVVAFTVLRSLPDTFLKRFQLRGYRDEPTTPA
jgi:energy-coupling factor transport system substrate-specific component